jgi:hypothetical protein
LITNTREEETELPKVEATKIQGWGEAVDISGFCGRNTELTRVLEWIVNQLCQLVVVLGMGEIGKTGFSIKLAQEDYVILRSRHLWRKNETAENLGKSLYLAFHSVKTRKERRKESGLGIVTNRNYPWRC